MGLKITKFEKGGNTYENAYAKIVSLSYDNNTKVLGFDVAVYPAKGSDNLIATIDNLWLRPADGNYVAQCYERINTIIAQTKANIAQMQADIAADEDDNRKIQLEVLLSNIKRSDIMALDGALED